MLRGFAVMQPVLFSLSDVNTSHPLGASNAAQAGYQSPLNNNTEKPPSRALLVFSHVNLREVQPFRCISDGMLKKQRYGHFSPHGKQVYWKKVWLRYKSKLLADLSEDFCDL